ncbi:CocE/NonD family hydrolase [Massilia pseudoviolaceinigra]|uniref:CocE/NonD family hydrolase n=1 Tax=Massilia pseudoviolaceinigra TaxID=3057165 RepID=UPI0027969295|nr:CocE/NonD family hydrolase [Massilia sp. CCM 9206]MDQ1921325.1 CocE/NonD family hydrolase [Massilia sp. CCM 9206]
MSRYISLSLVAMAICTPAAHASLCRPAAASEIAGYVSPFSSPSIISPVDGTCWVPEIAIASHDGTRLMASLFLPKGAEGGAASPGIVMVGSWATPGQYEYMGQAQRLAKGGYIVLSYTARGFYNSEGLAGVAAPADVRDVSSVLDWLQANTPVDMQNVGVSGISYGAGLSMMALAQDARFKTAVAFSGWGQLMDQMYLDGSANYTWSNVLNLLGAATGRRDPLVDRQVRILNDPDSTSAQIADVTAWAAPRSPSQFIAQINQRNAPVFISKNLQDDMFTANSSMAMFSALTGPKKLLLNKGIHALTEFPGALLGEDNYPYDEARRWFDRFLKGVRNGVDTEPQVSMQVRPANVRESFGTWPAPEVAEQTWHLTPRGALRFDFSCFCRKGDKGTLSAVRNSSSATDTIHNFSDTTATTGPLPLLASIRAANDIAVVTMMQSVGLSTGVRYEGAALATPLKIRGVPRLTVQVAPSQARAQLVAYLYDVDAIGIARLITYGSRSVHAAVPGQTVRYPIELSAAAYDIPAGHHLGIVIDTADPLYAPAVRPGERFSMRLVFDRALESTLVLPVRQQ